MAVFTVLCKKNANEFRRISAIVQPKNRRNFGRNFVISQSNVRRIFGELRENSLIQERNFEAISFVPKRNFVLLIENSKS